MRMIRAATLAWIAILLTPCAARPQAKPENVGLLVGLSTGRTLWIAPQNGVLRLVSTKHFLLVPRADGFWWAGIARRCGVDDIDGSGMNVTEVGAFLSRNESIFVVRAGDTARVSVDGVDCDVAEREVMAKRAAGARARADSLARAGDSTELRALASKRASPDGEALPEDLECSIQTREITFVSASAISVEERDATTEFCSPAKYYTSGRNVVKRFGSDERIPLRPLLSPDERANVTREFSSSGACGFEEETSEDHMDEAWSVRRVQGEWRATFFVDGPIVCRGGTELELSPALPSSFTSDTPLPVAWTEIRRRIPGARDAAGDPRREHVAIIAGDSLSIIRVRAGRLAETLAKVPIWDGEHFVMMRWATPEQIARWNRIVPTLHEPAILVTPRPD